MNYKKNVIPLNFTLITEDDSLSFSVTNDIKIPNEIRPTNFFFLKLENRKISNVDFNDRLFVFSFRNVLQKKQIIYLFLSNNLLYK